MKPTHTMDPEIIREVERFRPLDGSTTLRLGIELTDFSLGAMADSVRKDHPEMDASEINKEMRRIIEKVRGSR
jgi:hypothetical protein